MQEECEEVFLCEPVMRTKVIANIVSCEANLDCESNGTECIHNKSKKYGNDTTFVALKDVCQSRG